MKSFFSLFFLLALAGRTAAQTGPWVEVNTINSNTPASYVLYQLVTLSPTFTWGIAYDGTSTAASPTINNSVRANNAAGTEFSFNSIVGTAGFKPTNITVPAGVTGNTTAFCGQYSLNGTSGRGGEVLRSTNGGANWQRITSLTNFAGPDSFCDWVYMFDANAGIAAGDPNPVPSGGVGQFEFLYTTNASAQPTSAVTWTRAQTPLPYDNREYPLTGSYTAVGDTIWAGTSHEVSGGPSGASRVLRSTDRGRTWTAYATPITLGQVQRLAFKDGRHGLGFTRTSSSTELMTTADGGQTWTLQTLPDPTTADTLRGKFYGTGVVAIPGRGFVSFGSAVRGNPQASNFGASFSPDGRTWTDLDKGHHAYQSAGLLACGTTGFQGYFGGITARATPMSQGGTGGLFQVPPGSCAAVPLAGRPGAAPALEVLPNPSPGGRFQLQLPAGAAANLVVTDALGRVVLSRKLGAAAARGLATIPLDLSQQPPGVYVLRLTAATGTATRRLVVE